MPNFCPEWLVTSVYTPTGSALNFQSSTSCQVLIFPDLIFLINLVCEIIFMVVLIWIYPLWMKLSIFLHICGPLIWSLCSCALLKFPLVGCLLLIDIWDTNPFQTIIFANIFYFILWLAYFFISFDNQYFILIQLHLSDFCPLFVLLGSCLRNVFYLRFIKIFSS